MMTKAKVNCDDKLTKCIIVRSTAKAALEGFKGRYGFAETERKA